LLRYCFIRRALAMEQANILPRQMA
jgi:hypothetical protein